MIEKNKKLTYDLYIPEPFLNLSECLKVRYDEYNKIENDIDRKSIGYNRKKQYKPAKVCLCGSTRFSIAFTEANLFFTLNLFTVLTIGASDKSDNDLRLTEQEKARLDCLHKHKILLCDFVFVLNVHGYIGKSTASEIAFAKEINKPIYFLDK